MKRIGLYLFDDVEVLDFAGPFEVFSTASRMAGRLQPGTEAPFEVCTIGETGGVITARGGLRVETQFSMAEHPALDVLVVPGGITTRELEKSAVVAWIAAQAAKAELTASICTGAFLLGKAGLLSGRRATTHWEDLEDMRALLPDTEVVEGPRWVDEGNIVTSAGISAAIDVSLHLVERLEGKELARRTARQMDYEWRETA